MSPDELPKGRGLDAQVELRLMGTVGPTVPRYSSSHAGSLALEVVLRERGWSRFYARGRDESRTRVRLIHADGRHAEADGPDPLVNFCHAALKALQPGLAQPEAGAHD